MPFRTILNIVGPLVTISGHFRPVRTIPDPFGPFQIILDNFRLILFLTNLDYYRLLWIIGNIFILIILLFIYHALSLIHYLLSIIHYALSIISYLLSMIHYPYHRWMYYIRYRGWWHLTILPRRWMDYSGNKGW